MKQAKKIEDVVKAFSHSKIEICLTRYAESSALSDYPDFRRTFILTKKEYLSGLPEQLQKDIIQYLLSVK